MTGISTFVDYQIVTRNIDRAKETILTRAQEEREINYFIENIGSVTTGDELIEDDRLYRFAMRAYGLESQIFAKGLMRKVFEEGVTEPTARANRMGDARFRDIAAAFQFAEVGGARTADPAFVVEVLNKYTAVRLEEDQPNEGVRLALYFERNAPEIDNWFEALADPALAEVVRVGLGFSEASAAGDIDRYAERIGERFPIEDLQDPEKVGKFLKTFAIRWDIENGVADQGQVARVGLFTPLGVGPRAVSIDPLTWEAALATR